MKLRRAGTEDAAKLALLGGASFLETFADDHPGDAIVAHVAAAHSAESYATMLADPAFALWLVEADARAPVGYAMMGPATLPGSSAGDLELKRIYVLSRWHVGGWGRALCEAVEHEAHMRGATRLLLSVYVKNDPAIRFYAGRGFVRVGAAHFADFPPEFHDHVMAKALTASPLE
ncbi:MAG: GNAT family N-acetyltransferase [Sphingomonadaceae bacterium]|nr:GNAT family N-acetyltransferase [Sphingomonadaceae bacterium]